MACSYGTKAVNIAKISLQTANIINFLLFKFANLKKSHEKSDIVLISYFKDLYMGVGGELLFVNPTQN